MACYSARGVWVVAIATLVISGCFFAQRSLAPKTPDLRSNPVSIASGSAGIAPESAGIALESAGTTTGPVLAGQIRFPDRARERRIQATTADIIKATVISLIDPDTNRSIAAALSQDDGNFQLVPPAALVPGNVYVLEGVKGLRGGLPGGDSVRLRTFVSYAAGSWSTVSTPSIVIDALTTAVTLTSQLHSADVPRASTMNKVQVTGSVTSLNVSPSWATHPDAELSRTMLAIRAYAAADLDPVESVTAIKPTLVAISAATARPGDVLRLTGDGFYSIPGSNTVFVGTATASVLLAQPTSLVIQVPSSIGSVMVRTPQGDSGTLPFSLETSGAGGLGGLALTGLSPEMVLPGESVTVYGSGFDPVTANNQVFFGFSPQTITSGSTGSLVVTVPAGFVGSLVSVGTPKGVSNAGYLRANFYIASAPVVGSANEEITLTGLFPTLLGKVRFNGQEAEIQSWSTAAIRAVLPLRVGAGPISVVSGGTIIKGATFEPRVGTIGSFIRVPGLPTSFSSYQGFWNTSKYGYFIDTSTNMWRAEYSPNGDLFNVTTVGRQGLPQVHFTSFAQTAGNFAYFAGDYGGVDNRRVYQAPINGDGIIGTFAVFNSLLFAAGGDGSIISWPTNSLLRIKNKLWSLRIGRGDYPNTLKNHEWAPIGPDGTIGAWVDSGIPGHVGQIGHPIVIGSRVYKAGGFGSETSISWAPLDAAGDTLTGNFQATASLPAGMSSSGTGIAVVGKYLYVLSYVSNNWSRAEILADDSLGAWEGPSTLSPIALEYHGTRAWVRGRFLYFMNAYGVFQAPITS